VDVSATTSSGTPRWELTMGTDVVYNHIMCSVILATWQWKRYLSLEAYQTVC